MAGIVLGLRAPIVDADGVPTQGFWGKLAQLAGAVGALSNNGFPVLPSYTKATIPTGAKAGARAMAFVTDATGGAQPFFSDGTNWRRFSDLTVIS